MISQSDERQQYSQNGEDGVISKLFELLGGGRTFVEIGSGPPGCKENNTEALLARGWTGIQLDAERGHKITASNVLSFLPQSFDFLSMDIDGQDYYVLQAIVSAGVRPRVIVTEFNACLGPVMKMAVPRDDDFKWDGQTYYFGASLAALACMLGSYGYTLVYVESHGVNAFFVRTEEWARLHWKPYANALAVPDKPFVAV